MDDHELSSKQQNYKQIPKDLYLHHMLELH